MEIQPTMVAARFEQLEPGSLFIFPFTSGSSYALKVTPPEPGSRALILPMGPSFPSDDERQPRLLNWQAETAVSFGTNFIFRPSTTPDAWSNSEPSLNYFCCGLFDGEIYLRANADPFRGYLRCWVRLQNGALSWQEPRGITAYSTQWEVFVLQGSYPPKLVIPMSGDLFRSRQS